MPIIGYDKLGHPVILLQTEKDHQEVELYPVCYLVGANGLYLKRCSGLITSVTPVDRLPILEHVASAAALRAKKLSPQHFAAVLMFFRTVYRKRNGAEALVALHYDATASNWKLDVPPQQVTSVSVDADYSIRYEDYLLVGTIHSHNSMKAFHSGIDHRDETEFDGLHLVFGNVNEAYPSITGILAVNGTRFKVDPLDWFVGLVETTITKQVPANRRETLSLGVSARGIEDIYTNWQLAPYGGGRGSYGGGYLTGGGADRRPPPGRYYQPPYRLVQEQRYNIALPEGVTLRDFYPPPKEWMANVQKLTIPQLEGEEGGISDG